MDCKWGWTPRLHFLPQSRKQAKLSLIQALLFKLNMSIWVRPCLYFDFLVLFMSLPLTWRRRRGLGHVSLPATRQLAPLHSSHQKNCRIHLLNQSVFTSSWHATMCSHTNNYCRLSGGTSELVWYCYCHNWCWQGCGGTRGIAHRCRCQKQL